MLRSVAWRCNGYGVGLTFDRSRVRFSAVPLPNNDPGQVVHTHVPLSPSSVIWYWPKGGDAAAGKATLVLASHWPYVTDFSGLSTYGLNGQRKRDEHPTYAPTGVRSTLLLL